MEELRQLTISGSALVTDAGLVHLEKLKDLRFLDLSGTRCTVNGTNKLQSAIPQVSIVNN